MKSTLSIEKREEEWDGPSTAKGRIFSHQFFKNINAKHGVLCVPAMSFLGGLGSKHVLIS